LEASRQLRRRLILQNGFFVVLLLAAVLMLVRLAQDYRLQWDLTQSGRHTVSKATRDVLAQMHGPVTITAYATEQDAELGDIRKIIHDFVEPYRRAKPDLTLRIVDPREYPKLAAEAKVRVNGELVITYGDRSEHLTNLNEQALTNLLMRLSRGSERMVAALDGHGERRLTGSANHDLGDFGKQLESKGLRLGTVNLGIAQAVPDNTAVLVIASPQIDLLPGEVEKVKRFLERGGNLLWLIDQEPLHGLEPVAEYLSVVLSPGTVVDPAARQMGLPQTNAVVHGYGNHAIVRDFTLNAVFPFARQIGVVEGKEWRAFPLIEVAPRGWLESGEANDAATFDRESDAAGPVTIGYALERSVEDRTQRVVVIGTAHFLANTYLGLAGNLDLGVNIVNWLVGDDDLITIQPRATVDSSLELGRVGLFVIAAGFLVLLPVAFLATGAVSWWRRRRL
jgi:ABC-type uncharacterized transport system involved in gliding motility auxiliary subunit